MIYYKICCISSLDEAKMAIRYGAAALGLVGEMPSGPGVIPDDKIQAIASLVPPPVSTFLLTSRIRASDIIAHHKSTRTTTLQLVDKVRTGSLEQIRDALPAVKLVQVIHVLGESSVQEAKQVAPYVDALLLDSGNPNLKIRELGGTGRVHNWEISRQIRESVSIPIFLAGGLRPDNVVQAIRTVKPFGVDICSGLRTDGRLDEHKLAAFTEAVRNVNF